MKKKHKARNKKISLKLRIFYFFAVLIFLILVAINYTNNRVMPMARKVMDLHAVGKSTKAIDSAVKTVIANSGLTSSDLYTKSVSENGKLTSLSADTVLINSVCSDVADQITEELNNIGDESMNLPLGIITGVEFLSTKGPRVLSVTLAPLGDCQVDYKTSFKSEGINQVNYQIWLDVKTTVATVNPLAKNEVNIKRSIPIVNTYISGDVPESVIFPNLNKIVE